MTRLPHHPEPQPNCGPYSSTYGSPPPRSRSVAVEDGAEQAAGTAHEHWRQKTRRALPARRALLPAGTRPGKSSLHQVGEVVDLRPEVFGSFSPFYPHMTPSIASYIIHAPADELPRWQMMRIFWLAHCSKYRA